MSETSRVILTIFGTGLVTWLSRVLPFAVLKKIRLPKIVLEYLSFVPIVIMSALWFDNLFIQHLGQVPTVNVDYLLATFPAVVTAVITKSLLAVVLVGMAALALIRYL